jgi:hypothetical protein
MNTFFTVVLGALCSLIGLLILAVCLGSIKAVWRAVPVVWETLCDVNWKFCFGHSALGFVVALLVVPSLPIPLVIAAGVVSTTIVAMAMQKLEEFELSRPSPTPAPARIRVEGR